jgi:MoaA/NifB/PqqE/SkfB family radical SAM enzyme
MFSSIQDVSLPNVTQPTLVVLWRVVTACPLSCHFCAYSNALQLPRRVADEETIIRFGRLLSQYQTSTGRSVLLSWLGGEPLVWPRLPSVAYKLAADYQLPLSITTNGLPLEDQAIRDLLRRTHREVTISVDGLAEFHDTVRAKPGLFARICRAVQQLRQEAPELLLRVNTILMRDNIEMFPDFCHEMARWGFDQLTFNLLGGRDRPEFYRDHHVWPEQLASLFAQWDSLSVDCLSRGLRLMGSVHYRKRLQRAAHGEPYPIDDCHPGSNFLFIDEFGRVSPCSFTSSTYGISVDQLQTLDDFDTIRQLYRSRRAVHRDSACDDCLATHVFEKFVTSP